MLFPCALLQVVSFESWLSDTAAVQEVQQVSLSSSCASHLCGSTFFSLGYGHANTGTWMTIIIATRVSRCPSAFV